MTVTGSSGEDEAYNRGMIAGRVEQRLQGHDDHFRKINGSIDSMTGALRSLTDELRANVTMFSANVTSDRRDAEERDKVVVTVAAALMEKANEIRAGETSRWAAWQRWLIVVGSIVLTSNFALAFYLVFGR
ncbi:hypothetical protein OG792_25955 [Micromonospora sp. NBC_01699]|uniref:hypothetical protein n=1 Tax=Micromonospora sp. NBC_01699 TaxID=2975984 RepID=UPI002E28ADF5|nr:hypothetical protein [Micromonospora sp. NBC_01699]